MEALKMTVVPNGPLKAEGLVEITLADGTVEQREKTTFFCRCGASARKPFCDGTHRKIGFEG